MSYQASIGKKLRELRISHGMTQEELAVKVGYTSRSSINKIELGYTDLPLTKIISLADALGVSPLELIFPELAALLGEHELALLLAYKANPRMQPKVDKILNVSKVDGEKSFALYSAACAPDSSSDGFEYDTNIEEKLRNAPETDETLV
ncbi:MAG: helix-turn-helix transcriptional regulator [Clostridia bacterium]|nr:helix-turn-helix transcriptional regulator [Clostridia bacterium]